jgi:hypothetical protein
VCYQLRSYNSFPSDSNCLAAPIITSLPQSQSIARSPAPEPASSMSQSSTFVCRSAMASIASSAPEPTRRSTRLLRDLLQGIQYLATGYVCPPKVNVTTPAGSVAKFGVGCGSPRKRSDRASVGDLEQCGDEFRLSPDVAATDVPNLSLPNHRHRLEACRCSSGRPEAAKSTPWAGRSFHIPVVLLHDIVQVFHLA